MICPVPGRPIPADVQREAKHGKCPAAHRGGSFRHGAGHPARGCQYFQGQLSGEKAITSFVFAAADNPGLAGDVAMTISEADGTITGSVPFGTAVTAMKPIITVSARATVDPASGVARSFTTAATYAVTAENGTTASYAVTVSVGLGRSDKAITAFTFRAADNPTLAADLVMTVSESSKTVTGTAPLATVVTALKPTIVLSSGATVSPTSGAAADFSAAVTYTVTAEDGSTAAYVATVSVTPSVASCAGVIGDGYVALLLHFSGPGATVRDIATNMTIVDASGSQVAVPVSGTWSVDSTAGRITGWTFVGTGTFKLWGSDAGPASYSVSSTGTIDQNGTTVGHVSVVPAATPSAAPVVGGVLGEYAQGAEITGARVYRGTITTTIVGTYEVRDYTDVLIATGTVSDAGVFAFFLGGSSVMFCASFRATATPTFNDGGTR